MNPTHFHVFDRRKVKHEHYYTEETIGENKPSQCFYNCESKSTENYGFLSLIEPVILLGFSHDLQMKFRLWCSYFTHEISGSHSNCFDSVWMTGFYHWQLFYMGLVIHGCGITSVSNNLSWQSKVLSDIDLTSVSCVTRFLIDRWANVQNETKTPLFLKANTASQ